MNKYHRARRGRSEVTPLRTKDAYRSQIINGTLQIETEARLRRIAQFVSREFIDEHGGLLTEEVTLK